jgi:thiol-disulfide isomerase/thioredoxin
MSRGAAAPRGDAGRDAARRRTGRQHGGSGNSTAGAGASACVTGVIALIAALAAAAVLGAALRWRAGRFTPVRRRAGNAGGPAGAQGREDRAESLTAADLGAELGERATLVQFSTPFCSYCGPARELLGEVAAEQPGVAVIEIDAAERMDLARRLRILATPTVLVLGPDGTIVARSSGRPRKAAVRQAVGSVS